MVGRKTIKSVKVFPSNVLTNAVIQCLFATRMSCSYNTRDM